MNCEHRESNETGCRTLWYSKYSGTFVRLTFLWLNEFLNIHRMIANTFPAIVYYMDGQFFLSRFLISHESQGIFFVENVVFFRNWLFPRQKHLFTAHGLRHLQNILWNSIFPLDKILIEDFEISNSFQQFYDRKHF